MVADNIQKASALARLGIWVFPVYVTPDESNPYKTTKRPATPNGFYDATNDPFFVEDLFERHPKAEVGVWMGPSGLLAADIDVKRAPDGTIEVDGWENFELSWEDLPDTFAFDSISGAGGKQFIYLAPEGKNLGPSSNYRKIQGFDRRAGGSYSVWAGGVPASRDEFAPAPEWLLDESAVRSAANFEGTVKEWYETLEPGEPSLIVRAAIDRARKAYAEAGDDFSHSDIVERQFEAVRLGSEGHPGVPELLGVLEELTMNRTGSHSRPEEEWEYEFHEALASGVAKYGDAIELRKGLIPYDISIVPPKVPASLFTGESGDKDDFSALLRALQQATDDDNLVLSILWGAPKTREISREWGLLFVRDRVAQARSKPEPERENPTLPPVEVPTPEKPVLEEAQPERSVSFLTDEERERVKGKPTFIDTYVEASNKKGFHVPYYDIPNAIVSFSMTMGTRVVIPYNSLGTNVWFIMAGNSGTGKSQSESFARGVMDNAIHDEMGYYNLGATSSPSAIHEELLVRDGLASMIHHDEAASFFQDLNNQEWMKNLEHHFSKFYDGQVEPSNKVRLPKELRGLRATTSFCLLMSATPDKLFSLITTEMFASGFLARVNWTWAPNREEDDSLFKIAPSQVDGTARVHPAVFEVACDFAHAASTIPQNTVMSAPDEAWDRLSKVAKDMHYAAKKLDNFEDLKASLTRLRETIVKVSALFALYRGETEFTELDVLRAISYAEEWYETMIRVVNETSESEFSRDLNEIEAYIKSQNGSVTEAKLTHRFRAMIRRSPREIEDRISFLQTSGRIVRQDSDNKVRYVINE